jgi:hypothetical protein
MGGRRLRRRAELPHWRRRADATVLGVDFNGYHALSGFLLFLPAFYFARRADWAFYYDAFVALALFATGIWALLDQQPAWVFYFPDNASDGIFHLVTGTLFAVLAAVQFAECPPLKERHRLRKSSQ